MGHVDRSCSRIFKENRARKSNQKIRSAFVPTDDFYRAAATNLHKVQIFQPEIHEKPYKIKSTPLRDIFRKFSIKCRQVATSSSKRGCKPLNRSKQNNNLEKFFDSRIFNCE